MSTDPAPRTAAPLSQGHAQSGATASLGLPPVWRWGLPLVAGLPAGLAAYLGGAPLLAAALAALAGWAFGVLGVHRGLGLLESRVTEPMARALAAVEERSRASQISRLSAEAAFERIHAVLQSLVEGVILVDADGGVVLANPCARRILEGGSQPVEGRALAGLLPDGLRGQVLAGVASLREGREHVQIMGLQAGERVYEVSMVHAQSLRHGAGFGTVVALVDVTRIHEIARLKDQFLDSVSHELRTPLTNICAFTEILRQLSPDNEQDWQEFLGIVSTESNRLKGLVEDLLKHSHLYTGQVDWRSGTVDLGRQVGIAVGMFAEQADRRGVELVWRQSAATCAARADSERLHEVLVRLIDNAMKFTPDGGCVRIEVSDLGSAIEVAVDDSGPGVPLAHRESVFERFHQIGDLLTEKPAGAGLGLPICRGFIDGMGGAIWCEESELGGAVFRFVLPSASSEGSVGEPDHDSDPADETLWLEATPGE